MFVTVPLHVSRCVKNTASVFVSLSVVAVCHLKALTAPTKPQPPDPRLDIHLLHRYSYCHMKNTHTHGQRSFLTGGGCVV